MMIEHGKSGRTFAGQVVQLITGSTGLDDFEWGVTLFAISPEVVKDVVYTMRFDKGSALYGEFGALLRRLPGDDRRARLTRVRAPTVAAHSLEISNVPTDSVDARPASKSNTSKRARAGSPVRVDSSTLPRRSLVVDVAVRRASRSEQSAKLRHCDPPALDRRHLGLRSRRGSSLPAWIAARAIRLTQS